MIQICGSKILCRIGVEAEVGVHEHSSSSSSSSSSSGMVEVAKANRGHATSVGSKGKASSSSSSSSGNKVIIMHSSSQDQTMFGKKVNGTDHRWKQRERQRQHNCRQLLKGMQCNPMTQLSAKAMAMPTQVVGMAVATATMEEETLVLLVLQWRILMQFRATKWRSRDNVRSNGGNGSKKTTTARKAQLKQSWKRSKRGFAQSLEQQDHQSGLLDGLKAEAAVAMAVLRLLPRAQRHYLSGSSGRRMRTNVSEGRQCNFSRHKQLQL